MPIILRMSAVLRRHPWRVMVIAYWLNDTDVIGSVNPSVFIIVCHGFAIGGVDKCVEEKFTKTDSRVETEGRNLLNYEQSFAFSFVLQMPGCVESYMMGVLWDLTFP